MRKVYWTEQFQMELQKKYRQQSIKINRPLQKHQINLDIEYWNIRSHYGTWVKFKQKSLYGVNFKITKNLIEKDFQLAEEKYKQICNKLGRTAKYQQVYGKLGVCLQKIKQKYIYFSNFVQKCGFKPTVKIISIQQTKSKIQYLFEKNNKIPTQRQAEKQFGFGLKRFTKKFKNKTWRQFLDFCQIPGQQYNKEKLIKQYQQICKENNNIPQSLKQVSNKLSRGIQFIVNRFGSWDNFVRQCGYQPAFERYITISDDQLIENYKKLCRQTNSIISGSQYNSIDGRIGSFKSIIMRFKTWNNFLKQCDVEMPKGSSILQRHILKRLKQEYNTLEICHRFRSAIPSKLQFDIYLPELKLAFQINGISHYQPIYGQKSFLRTTKNDKIKMQQCKTCGISLHQMKSNIQKFGGYKFNYCDKGSKNRMKKNKQFFDYFYGNIKSIIEESIKNRNNKTV